eukprot:1980248-Amphidinium_carterae.1
MLAANPYHFCIVQNLGAVSFRLSNNSKSGPEYNMYAVAVLQCILQAMAAGGGGGARGRGKFALR